MKKLIFLALISVFQVFFAQTSVLSEGHRTIPNNDKRLYKVSTDSGGQFLGEIEISGPLINPVKAFDAFYRKSKLLGANGYTVDRNKDLNGEEIATAVQKIHLYYFEKLPVQENVVYILNPGKARKYRINGDKKDLSGDAYSVIELQEGKEIQLTTGGLLGSMVSLNYKLHQPAIFLTLNSGGLGASQDAGNGGIVIKTGDLVQLENSFGLFFTIFYSREE